MVNSSRNVSAGDALRLFALVLVVDVGVLWVEASLFSSVLWAIMRLVAPPVGASGGCNTRQVISVNHRGREKQYNIITLQFILAIQGIHFVWEIPTFYPQ